MTLAMTDPIDILGCDSLEFVRQAADHGIPQSTSMRIYRQVFRTGVKPQGATLPVAINIAPIAKQQHEHATTKFIQRHDDGPGGLSLETESVILPIPGSTGRIRHTLCLSSQIGCAMGCVFCETAQMGLMKNLTPAQIVGQWFAARHVIGSPIDNIVFMGMGEPMDNLDAVLDAIRILCDRNGPALAASNISVSTVGRVDGVRRLAALARTTGFHRLRLAVSINAPNDEIRSQIMPLNRATPMTELMEAMLEWPMTRKQRVFIEYVLIPGVNDADEHADELCQYLRALTCTVNVIPYNPRRNSPWPAPDEESVSRFMQRIHNLGQFVKRRQTMCRNVMAACGQLGNAEIRKRKCVPLGSG